MVLRVLIACEPAAPSQLLSYAGVWSVFGTDRGVWDGGYAAAVSSLPEGGDMLCVVVGGVVTGGMEAPIGRKPPVLHLFVRLRRPANC